MKSLFPNLKGDLVQKALGKIMNLYESNESAQLCLCWEQQIKIKYEKLKLSMYTVIKLQATERRVIMKSVGPLACLLLPASDTHWKTDKGTQTTLVSIWAFSKFSEL